MKLRWGWSGPKRLTQEGREGGFGGDSYILYLDCGGVYMGEHTCQNSSSYKLDVD